VHYLPSFIWQVGSTWQRTHLLSLVPHLVTKKVFGELFIELNTLRGPVAHSGPERCNPKRQDEIIAMVKKLNYEARGHRP
jgi:hypothetical protein